MQNWSIYNGKDRNKGQLVAGSHPPYNMKVKNIIMIFIILSGVERADSSILNKSGNRDLSDEILNNYLRTSILHAKLALLGLDYIRRNAFGDLKFATI